MKKRVAIDNMLYRSFLVLVTATIGNLWLFFSYIDIEFPLVALVNIISIVMGWYLVDTLNRIRHMKISKKQFAFIILATTYVSFSAVGSNGIMYPIDRYVSAGRMLELLTNAAWSFLMIISVIHLFDKMKSIPQKTDYMSVWEHIIITFMFIFIPLVVMLIAFNPGICSYDTNLCLSIYAHNMFNIVDNQPFFYILFLRGIISIVDSTYTIVIVQILMWCGIWIEAFVFLNKKVGIDFKRIAFLAICVGFNSANLFYVVTIWKDIPYTICILLATILCAQIISKCNVDIYYCIKLIIALVGIFMFRKNGPVTYIFCVAFWGCLGFKNKLKNILVSIGITLIMIFIVSGPCYNYFGVKKDENSKGTMYVGLSQELFAAYEYGKVSNETENMLMVLSHGNLESYEYNPYWANAAYNLDVKPIEFIKCYIDSFIHNPRIMIKAILLRQDCLWNCFPGEKSFVNLVNYYGGWDDTEEWKEYYSERKWTGFSRYVARIVSYQGEDSTLNAIIWRSGIHLSGMIIVIVAFLIVSKKYFHLSVIVPILGQIVSLFLSTGWADFRYYWCVNVVSVFIVAMLIGRISNSNWEY